MGFKLEKTIPKMKYEKETLIDNLISVMDALLNGEADGQCRLLLMLDEVAVFNADDAKIVLSSIGSSGAENRNINFEIIASGQIKSKRLSLAQFQLLKQWYNLQGRQELKSHFESIRLN